MESTNNVLVYVNQHLSSADHIVFPYACKLIFTEEQIETSRRHLLDICAVELKLINPEIEKRVNSNTPRKSSINRTKTDQELLDIITTIKTFSSSEKS